MINQTAFWKTASLAAVEKFTEIIASHRLACEKTAECKRREQDKHHKEYVKLIVKEKLKRKQEIRSSLTTLNETMKVSLTKSINSKVIYLKNFRLSFTTLDAPSYIPIPMQKSAVKRNEISVIPIDTGVQDASLHRHVRSKSVESNISHKQVFGFTSFVDSIEDDLNGLAAIYNGRQLKYKAKESLSKSFEFQNIPVTKIQPRVYGRHYWKKVGKQSTACTSIAPVQITSNSAIQHPPTPTLASIQQPRQTRSMTLAAIRNTQLNDLIGQTLTNEQKFSNISLYFELNSFDAWSNESVNLRLKEEEREKRFCAFMKTLMYTTWTLQKTRLLI